VSAGGRRPRGDLATRNPTGVEPGDDVPVTEVVWLPIFAGVFVAALVSEASGLSPESPRTTATHRSEGPPPVDAVGVDAEGHPGLGRRAFAVNDSRDLRLVPCPHGPLRLHRERT